MRAILLWDLYAYKTLESRLRTFLYRLRRAGPLGAVKKAFSRLATGLRLQAPEAPYAGRAVELSATPPLETYTRQVQTLTDAGVQLLFVYSGGEPEWFNHTGQFKGMFGRYPFYEKVAFNYLEVSDHLITSRKAQMAFLETTENWVVQRVLNQ